VSFSDALASSDAVISKPGFGILSDCVVNQKPLIYADRSDFLEYAILESAIKKYLKNVHIPSADLYRGDLSENLSRIWNSPNPSETIGRGGDVAAARRIAHMAGVI
jgi:L-arabinokinase